MNIPAKDKASELVDKFAIRLGNTEDGEPYFMPLSERKQCALIVIEEKIETLRKLAKKSGTLGGYWYISEKEYLQIVKTEIEILKSK